VPDRNGKGLVIAMRAVVRIPKRAGKEFLSYLIGLLMAYAPIAVLLVLAVRVPLGGVLIFGVIGVPIVAALLAVLSVVVGGVDDTHPGSSRPYDYDPGSDPVLRSGGGYGASGGWHDYGGPDGADGNGW
jgi:hypothetical protein